MTAASQVFAIPELLENILLHLHERDLLLAQRVKRSFRDVTTASVHLQRKLFLTADPLTEDGLVQKLKRNPFIDIFRPEKGLYYQNHDWIRSVYMYRWRGWSGANVESSMSIDEIILLHFAHLDFKALKNVDHPSASWKRMFFTQPALRKMRIGILSSSQNERCGSSRKLENVSGLRIGQLNEIDWQGHESTPAERSIITEFARRGEDRTWESMLELPQV